MSGGHTTVKWRKMWHLVTSENRHTNAYGWKSSLNACSQHYSEVLAALIIFTSGFAATVHITQPRAWLYIWRYLNALAFSSVTRRNHTHVDREPIYARHLLYKSRLISKSFNSIWYLSNQLSVHVICCIYAHNISYLENDIHKYLRWKVTRTHTHWRYLNDVNETLIHQLTGAINHLN